MLIVSAERFVLDLHSAAAFVAAVVATAAAAAVEVVLALPGHSKKE